MNAPTRPWTALSPQEKRAAVKKRILAGKSWREIADDLQINNRNCIAGVVTRLRELGELPPTDKGRVAREGNTVKKALKKALPKPKAAGLAAVNIAVRAESRAEAPGIAITRAAAFDPIPGVEPVPYGSPGCKWSVDGPEGLGLLWCGADRGDHRHYCADHRRLAYQPRHGRAA